MQSMMQQMEKMQEKGDLGEDELKALEMDVTGRVRLFPSNLAIAN